MSYPWIAVAGLVVAALAFALAVPRWRTRGVLSEVVVAVAVAAAVLCVLTVVFDSWMIEAGLFTYSSEALVGVYLGSAPVEDLSYPLAAVLLMPALWELARRREP